MIQEIFEHAVREFPDSAETVEKIIRLRSEASGQAYEEFFEPKSVFDLSGKQPRLIAVSLPDVEAWAKHMAYSTRVRMLSLEPMILQSVVSRRLTPAMVMLRSHSETAGLACLALMTLRDGDVSQIRDVMQRSLFGSALANGWKRSEDLAMFVPATESQPPSASQLMDALDRFVAAGDKGNGRYRAAYGLMCEYAHPNSRGMLGFARSVEDCPFGWRIRYSPTEEVTSEGVTMALGLLLEMMRLGHSASELLRLGAVRELGEGFSIDPPEPREMNRVLRQLMLLEAESPARSDLIH